MTDTIRCTFVDHRGLRCPATTTQPYSDDWSGLAAWGPGIPDGFYCKRCADAIEAALEADELEEAAS
jgi:hypothetical protein